MAFSIYVVVLTVFLAFPRIESHIVVSIQYPIRKSIQIRPVRHSPSTVTDPFLRETMTKKPIGRGKKPAEKPSFVLSGRWTSGK